MDDTQSDTQSLDTASDPGRISTTALTFVPDEQRYREDGVLGRGGMGVINALFDRRIGRRVACKELRSDIARDGAVRSRFLREARVQAQLEHPAIVPVYEIGQRDDGAPYFTMKTVQGTTLADLLVTAKPSAQHRLLAAFSRICLAVDFAHQRGVLHRDLKPANLILGDYGEVYVLDWGLAKVVGEPDPDVDPEMPSSGPGVTNANALLGTPGYMAPEQIDDASAVGPEADVYSLGAILFEILAHEPLHPRGFEALASTRGAVEARISVRAPSRNTPLELEKIVVRAVAPDPPARPSPRELADAIDRYLEGERDLELRRERSATYAFEALRAAREAKQDSPTALAARRDAMNAINRALVLDPSNMIAMATMADLLQHVPERPPPEVEVEIERKFRRNLRWLAKLGGVIYGSMLGYLAVIAWMGIRQPAVVAAAFVLIAVAGVTSSIAAREREPSTVVIAIVAVTSMLAFSFVARITSPFLIVPGAILINACGFAVYVRKRQRLFVLAVSLGAWLMPLVLELAGALPPTFAFRDDQLVILPVATHLPRLATLFLIVIVTVTGVYLATVMMGYIADRLVKAEERLFMYAWQLRELVPAEVRAVTDPVGTMRKDRT